MNASLITDSLIANLQSRYGPSRQIGRSSVFAFNLSLTCSINYSKLLRGHKFFFGIIPAMADPTYTFEKTIHGEFILLVCGSVDAVLVLPRRIMLEMLVDVTSRRVDVFVENGIYILQTTKHPKLDVSEFLNAFPTAISKEAINFNPANEPESNSRDHVRIQHSLITLGRAEGCGIWVPINDKNLAHQGQAFSDLTLGRLPNFGFDENTRRIVQNIDVLWLQGNVIRKAFEIESTTSIYSGLLRLNDLSLAQPNNQIELFIAAPERRKPRVFDQLTRPTFQPLVHGCRFISFEEISKLIDRVAILNLDISGRVTGLVQGEAFSLPEHVLYPTNI
jgi:hypothetical protein